MTKKTFFISTSIPYVNASPHIGHALEFVQADVIARFHRLKEDDVFFLTGTDDNALKNVQSAAEAYTPVQEFVNANAYKFKTLAKNLGISNDDFIRTSLDERHILGAQKLWKSLKAGDIYKKKYRGLYCLGCEEFKTEKDLIDGACPEHPNKKPEIVEEENYFFKLSAYQDKLIKLIRDDEIAIIPKERKNEILKFIERGLEDFSVSRSNERAKNWGISVPGDSTQKQYVWVDALSNYITALGYATNDPRFKKYWENGDQIVHVIGKGINRFHSIYWPALLLSADIRLPKQIFVHGYLTVNGLKMSKSLGNVIDPFSIINEYGAEALRYYLVRHVSPFEDGDFTKEGFKEVYNANLANGLGNLVSRVMKMATGNEIKFDEKIAKKFAESKEVEELYKKQIDSFEKFNIQEAANSIWELIGSTDALIQKEQPFKKIKTDKVAGEKDIKELLARLDMVGTMLVPILPATAAKIIDLIKNSKMPSEPLFMRKE
ncbi:MAG: methionine--tRNA ligase [Candidatus Paceibacterota bacterium]